MRALLQILLGWLVTGAVAAAGSCEALQAQIDAKIRAAGVAQFTLTTLDSAASAAGKVVGTCDQGARKIVYARGGDAAASPPSGSVRPASGPKGDGVLTECKDGSVSMGGHCGR